MENYTKKEVDDHGNVCYFNSKNQRHRLDGPAIEDASGTKEWWVNNKIHRLDGPAIIWTNGENYWCLNDKLYSRTNHNRLVLFFILEPRRIGINPMEE